MELKRDQGLVYLYVSSLAWPLLPCSLLPSSSCLSAPSLYASPTTFADPSLSLYPVSVESEGPYAPEELLPEAVSVMRGKIAAIRAAAEALLQDAQDRGDAPSGPDADEDVEMCGA